MTPRHRMSENERLGCFMLLFPIFWPFIPVVLLCALVEAIANKIRSAYWRVRFKKGPLSQPLDEGDNLNE